MRTSLRRAIETGDYCVDPDAVADAILRCARAARPASDALLPAQLLDPDVRPSAQLLETSPPELDAMSPDDPP